MSMVKMVDAELKMEVNDDINAANITANMRPRNPEVREENFLRVCSSCQDLTDLLTMRHDVQDQFDVGDVGTTSFRKTNAFALFRI